MPNQKELADLLQRSLMLDCLDAQLMAMQCLLQAELERRDARDDVAMEALRSNIHHMETLQPKVRRVILQLHADMQAGVDERKFDN